MKKFYIFNGILLTTFIIQCNIGYCQNLIPNPGFEIYYGCPTTTGQVDSCVGWTNVEWSPDYFNSCNSFNVISVPFNMWGYQQAHSGCSYCGLYSIVDNLSYGKECIQAQLSSTLSVGTKYYFSFNVSLSDGGVTAASNKIGFRLSTMAYIPGNNNSPPVDNFATFYTDSIITDTTNWTTLSGSFVADSAYNFITFGNFFDSLNIQVIFVSGISITSYYYIDDVCLSPDSVTCITVTDSCRTIPYNGISEYDNSDKVILLPNPFTDELILTVEGHGEMEVCIYDVNCREILKRAFNSNLKLNTSALSAGIYYYRITERKGFVKNGKIVKS